MYKKTIQLPDSSKLNQKGFTFGAATAAFQIEGDRAGRLDCIWDSFCASPGKIRDGSNGDIACDHVRRWPADIEILSDLGVDAYRLSISWPRVVDQHGQPRQQGLQFYRELLTELKARGIKSYVTLYHWDLPEYWQQQGGWQNRRTAYAFAQYAQIVANALGDLVYSYATLNEPFCSAYLGYEVGVHAPGLTSHLAGRHAAHHLLLGHGLAMQALRQHASHAKLGVVINIGPCYPASPAAADVLAAKRADDYHHHWYLQPLLEGQYPALADELSAWLPEHYQQDLTTIAQPLDFIGINYYTRNVYQHSACALGFAGVAAAASDVTQGPLTDMGWEVFADGLYQLLTELHQRYQLPPVLITENGAAMVDVLSEGEVADWERVDYFQQHLLAVDRAINDGVDVQGYFAWSLLDNFEWAEGYLKRFGIVYVDYASQQRILKQSAKQLKAFLSQRKPE